MYKLKYCIAAALAGVFFFFLVLSSPWWLLVGFLLYIGYVCAELLFDKTELAPEEKVSPPDAPNTPDPASS